MQAKKVALQEREYGKNPLSEKELREIIGNDPVADILNTRTPLYRERNMKVKPPSKEEAIQLILKDQNLLRRPVIVKGNRKLFGFNESDLRKLL